MPEQEPHDPSNVSFGLDIGASECAAGTATPREDRGTSSRTSLYRPDAPTRPSTDLTNLTVAKRGRLNRD